MNKKTVIAVSIALVLVGGLFVAMLVFWPKNSNKNIETPTLMTFTNPDIGVSIDYLSTWGLDLKDIEKGTIYFSTPETIAAFQKGEKSNQYDIALTVYNSLEAIPGNKQKLPIRDFAESSAFTDFQEIVTLDARSFYKVNTSDSVWPIVIFTENNGRFYAINLSDTHPSAGVTNIVNNIRFGGLGG